MQSMQNGSGRHDMKTNYEHILTLGINELASFLAKAFNLNIVDVAKWLCAPAD